MYKEDMKMAAEKTKIRLQGHEKFALREGWINKGLQTVPNYPDAFVRKDAPDIFGIGSNMVKSLRYWMKVFGLTEEKASVGVRLSRFGEIISTYDPYLEKIFTKHNSSACPIKFHLCKANFFDKRNFPIRHINYPILIFKS